MGLAGLRKAGVLCEILKEDGTMARLPDLMEIAKQYNLKIITIRELIRYRLRMESRVERVVTVQLPTRSGEFELIAFRDNFTHLEHLALVKGSWSQDDDVLVRIHSECLTGDVFHSARCDCGDQLEIAMQLVQEQECGVVLYMREEGRGIGLVSKLKAYSLQECGFDTVQANRALGFDAESKGSFGSRPYASCPTCEACSVIDEQPKQVQLAGELWNKAGEAYSHPVFQHPEQVGQELHEDKKGEAGPYNCYR